MKYYVKFLCLIFLSSLSVITISAQQNNRVSVLSDLPQFKRFHHIGKENGLSHTTAWHIIKDSHGFIWIATFDGLNRYDGYEIKVFKHDADDLQSLSSNFIKYIFEDKYGFLWVGTTNGFNKYNPETDKFTRYLFDQGVSETTANIIFEDSKGRLWIGSWHGDLYLFDRETEILTPYRPPEKLGRILRITEDNNGILWIGCDGSLTKFDPDKSIFLNYTNDSSDPDSLSHNKVIDIKIDRNNQFWIATVGGGINKFNPVSGKFTHYRHDSDDMNSLSSDAVMVLEEDTPGVFWVGTFGGGLNKFDTVTGEFIRYQPNSESSSIHDNRIPWLFKDDCETLWIGTFGNGVSFTNPYSFKFNLYKSIVGEEQSLSSNEVWGVTQDLENNIWIATWNGLDKFDIRKEKFSHYKNIPHNQQSLGSNQIQDIILDDKGILWIATWKNGLDRLDPETGIFKHYYPDPSKSEPLSEIQALEQDQFGNIWIGSFGGGLTCFNPVKEQFTNYQYDPDEIHSLKSNIILVIYKDRSDSLWIGTNTGISRFERSGDYFKNFNHQQLKGQQINTIYESENGILWIGAINGLHSYNRKDEIIETFTVKDGLSSNMVYGILEDSLGNLWLSTAEGISVFNQKSEKIINYSVESGLQNSDYISGSVYKTPGGEMFFGGKNGLNSLLPEMITDNPYIPPVALTDFMLHNSTVEIGKESPLKKTVGFSDLLTLTHKQNVFAFRFASLDYISPENNNYAYKMEGFDKDWLFTDFSDRQAKYTNLDAGKYIFRVKASNSDGVWNEEGVSVDVLIKPSWRESGWFKFLSISAVLLIIHFFIKWKVNDVETKKKKLELKVFERTSELVKRTEELEQSREKEHELAEERELSIIELQNALTEIKTLKGILPICSHCKKIRDDKGYWNQLEAYIREHSDAEFSHSLCEECAKKYYPEYYSN